MRTRQSFIGCAFALAAAAGCSGDFDTTRQIPKRATLGRELYSLVCDRIGANALREDVTAASYHSMCHPDASGAYTDRVDTAQLVPLDPSAVDVDGKNVPMAEQVKHRAYRIARVEALAHRREDMVKAFDASFPDEPIAVKDLANADSSKSCGAAGKGRLQKELGDVLGRLTDMENDRTIPLFTESLARIMNDVKASPEAQAALARFDARQGYRPSDIALGASRSLLSYPKLAELVNAFLKLVATDSAPFDPAGKIDPNRPLSVDNRKPIAGHAAAELQTILTVLREELRTAETTKAPAPLTTRTDPKMAAWTLLSRPRTSLELTRQILLQQDDAFDIGTGSPRTRFLVRRDARGVAAVPLVAGAVPSPFIDLTGDQGKPDGLPDLDPLGRFLTSTQARPPSPFFSVDGADGPRDPSGRAVGVEAPLLYDYIDTPRTFLARMTKDLRPLFDPDPSHDKETMMKMLGGLPIVFGARDVNAAAKRQYAPDPSRADDWALAHKAPQPPGLASSPVTLTYRGFHADTSPMVDLVYALGQTMADPVADDLLELGKKLMIDHPTELARLIGIGFAVKNLANQHPEAQIPKDSLLWDELLDTLAKIAAVKDTIGGGGILEDLILAFKKDETAKLQDTFAAYIAFKDELTYDRNNLNGPAFNLATNSVAPLQTPVDRTQPDVGANRSALQRFIQLLHDANGLAACTKEGAVAHVKFKLGALGAVDFDYPTSNLTPLACGIVGQPAPSRLPLCGILRLENIAALLLSVALNRAQFDVRDPCLKALMNSPLTNIVGGADAFLEAQSGIKGFSTHPTVAGISRLVFFDTAHDGLPGDTTPRDPDTNRFLRDILDPAPSMVCASTPFVDPSDGKTIALRKCPSFAETIRGRDQNALFPIEQNDFIKNVQALAAAFDDHKQPLLFVELFDTLHLHWGSKKQPKELCDPTADRKTDSRWCSQDGAVSYEPLLVDIFTKTDLFQALHDTIPVLEQTSVTHCDKQDPTTHACTQTSARNGVQILAEAVRVLVDPARNQGLKDRRGNAFAVRNDGTKNPQVTRIYLFMDAMNAIDASFDAWTSAHPNDTARQTKWRSARSQIVDTFFAIKGTGSSSAFANPAIPKIMPSLLDALHAQLLAHCPDRSVAGACAWAQSELPKSLSDVVGGPTFAALVDLLDAVRKDDPARAEVEALVQYLLEAATANDAEATTLAAVTDLLQVLSDDTNMAPLLRAAANAAGASLVDDDGKVVRRALLDAAIESMSRVFAKNDTPAGELCSGEVDPNHAIGAVLAHMVTPTAADRPAPLETLIDIVADVNRAKPGDSAKLEAGDYANIANEISEFCLDKGSGLEQVYEVIREATLTK